MAINKYQAHKAMKLAIARGSSPDPNFSRIDFGSLPEHANDEIVEKAGIAPPSYDEVVLSRRVGTAERLQDGKQDFVVARGIGHEVQRDGDSKVAQDVSRWSDTRSKRSHEEADSSDGTSAW
ncbi:hypothetical protein LTR91_018590 [Friedmanniomyces endolithicus]|uniref:Uncharacterized protein n=1 Tax=Friedmanniomyces endolithicus TaxID=329885 RepID=A0AAN6HD24_9PEZI|nr:hypothetical protein LTR59_009064 [Friedmanniomyces endolithicus]KAK0797174.1 hypothetical protein LTR38_008310 [Friedmanniomyces endolithicus]KAK0839176.1 hypothetical protein LTR03_011434 [Friedmanniomyces endolithicus]KAK0849568.1 hypothetical protein LTS02_013538 [Friedmanniomyces endolithicus]KAK0912985.1 hypothetical protein LTR02_002593 [Friedmanniomyces endolithicus]